MLQLLCKFELSIKQKISMTFIKKDNIVFGGNINEKKISNYGGTCFINTYFNCL